MSNIFKSKLQTGEHWISISDMMSGLMMIFLFIAVSYMLKVAKEKAQIEDAAVEYTQMREDLYRDLEKEFHDDLPKWKATINRGDLYFGFKHPMCCLKVGIMK